MSDIQHTRGILTAVNRGGESVEEAVGTAIRQMDNTKTKRYRTPDITEEEGEVIDTVVSLPEGMYWWLPSIVLKNEKVVPARAWVTISVSKNKMMLDYKDQLWRGYFL